jgi:polyisoprenoid-binding protein YceI
MKKIILTLAVAVFAASSAFAQLTDGKFNIDYKASTINWHGEKVTGSGHDGTIRVSSGQVTVAKGNLTAGKLKVDMNGITCTDLTDAESNSNMINHLKSADFFNTAAFPDANFEIVSVKAEADKSGNTHKITGKFTIKGITKPVTFDITVAGNTATTAFKVDRTKYDIKYNSGNFFENLGDKTINVYHLEVPIYSNFHKKRFQLRLLDDTGIYIQHDYYENIDYFREFN